MKSGGGSHGHVGMYVGQDWWTFLSAYDDHTPILDISCGSMTVAISVAERKVDRSGTGVRPGAGRPGRQVRGRGRAAARPASRT